MTRKKNKLRRLFVRLTLLPILNTGKLIYYFILVFTNLMLNFFIRLLRLSKINVCLYEKQFNSDKQIKTTSSHLSLANLALFGLQGLLAVKDSKSRLKQGQRV